MNPSFLRSTLTVVVLLVSTNLFAAKPGDWPQWRGANSDGISQEKGLLPEWPEGGPKTVWQVDTLGDGYSSLAIVDGRIFTQGNVDGEGRILCLKESDGSLIWSVHSPRESKLFKHGKGDGGRGTLTVDNGLVYAEGGGGDVTCLKAETGEIVWTKHLKDDFGGSVPDWGFSESPTIDGSNVIVTPGGKDGAVVALNKLTGDVVWRSAGVGDKAHYCSAVIVESHGVRQVITFTGGIGSKKSPVSPARVIGLDAETGDLLWSYDKSANRTANVSTPLFHNNAVFSASAYGTGGGLARLTKSDDGFVAEPAYFESKIQNHHGGMVLVDGFIYGTGSNSLICMNFETGEIVWQDRSAGKGAVTYADGHIYLYGEKNKVALVEANPKVYVEKGFFEVEKGDFPAWAHPVVANGRLYLRDMEQLTAFDIRK
ncbi:MAG: PQQ-binding-like beta-propeller repeat protein [Planctomycetales bacterium]|jgi:outer membrane protein assembly factor BamB